MLQCYSVTISMSFKGTVVEGHNVTVWQCYSITALECPIIKVLEKNCVGFTLCYNLAVSLLTSVAV